MVKLTYAFGRAIKQSGKLSAFVFFVFVLAVFSKFQSIFTQISKTEVLIEVSIFQFGNI